MAAYQQQYLTSQYHGIANIGANTMFIKHGDNQKITTILTEKELTDEQKALVKKELADKVAKEAVKRGS
jgi:hypothetical protein